MNASEEECPAKVLGEKVSLTLRSGPLHHCAFARDNIIWLHPHAYFPIPKVLINLPHKICRYEKHHQFV